ncbi:aggrecan core protein-like protein, partial [Leptotrombidium deliense]
MSSSKLKNIFIFIVLAVIQYCAAAESNFCPSNWKNWKNKCYYVGIAIMSYDENESLCHSLGATMVKIESLEENAFVSTITKKDKWFYLNAKRVAASQNEFRWTDDTTITFFNWKAGQPDNLHVESFACIEFEADGKWIDHNCTDHSMLGF